MELTARPAVPLAGDSRTVGPAGAARAEPRRFPFTTPNASDLKQYGLDKPQLTVVLGTGSSQASLLLGGKADDATLYAKDSSRPMVGAPARRRSHRPPVASQPWNRKRSRLANTSAG